MKTLIVTNDNYLGLTKCKNTGEPRINIKGSLYFYIEDIEIGGTIKNKRIYYDYENTLFSDKPNSKFFEGEKCKIVIDPSYLEKFNDDVLITLEDKFEEYFEEFHAQEAKEERDFLWNLPY